MLAELREATSERHAAVEDVVPLLDPKLDRAAYGVYLARLRGFYAPLDRALGQHDAAFDQLGFPPRPGSRTAALDHDLAALGAQPPAADREAGSSALPDLTTFEGALGCLYVLEGSALGGRVIARHLESALSLDVGRAATFLVPDPGGTTARWGAFRQLVESWGASANPEQRARVVAGATSTFDRLNDWIRSGAPYFS